MAFQGLHSRTCAAVCVAWILGAVSVPVTVAQADGVEHFISGEFSIQSRLFPKRGAWPGQNSRHATGVALSPRVVFEDDEGRSFTFAPFLRFDSADSKRTHADVREAYLLLFGFVEDNEWELRLGIDQVFWGVAESRRLVDIINQIDLVEHPDESAKLGQPMAHFTWSGDWGTLELFALPYHRKRAYPGASGRLRAPLPVAQDSAEYESGDGKHHVDLAARFSRTIGDLDVGLSVFKGTSREPFLRPDPQQDPKRLVPRYELIQQYGLDAQLIVNDWLFKLEAIRRTGQKNRKGEEEGYNAFVLGGEYTIYSIFDSVADLTLFGEWNHDERRENATNIFQNDLFFAGRYAFNDVESTEVIASVLEDLDDKSRVLGLEFNRRISDSWSLHLEGYTYLGVGGDPDNLLHGLRSDKYVQLDLNYNF